MKSILRLNLVLSDLKAYTVVIRETRHLRDRLAILIYLFQFPIRTLFKAIDRDYPRRLPWETTLENKDGQFLCGRSFNACRIASTFHESAIRKYFHISRGVFIDVGSHIGKYTVRVARDLRGTGRVISIEPEPHNFSLLEQNIALNNLHNVSIFKGACSAEDGQTTLYIDGTATTLHSIHNNPGLRKTTQCIVSTWKLDTLLKTLGINRVDLIKIDTEGAELDVLKGARHTLATHHPKIVFEAWNETILEDIEKALTPFKYRIKRMDETNYIAS